MGEVQVRADAVPELLDDGLAGACVMDETLLGFDPGVGRMVVQQARLDVGHQMHARLLELGVQCFGVWKLAFVPGEDVAAFAFGRVARAVVKGRDGNVFLGDAVDEAVELHLRIRCVGQAHGGLGKAQRPAWRQVRAANQLDELGHHLGRVVAGHQVVIEVAVIDLNIAKQLVVVVVLAAQVKGAGGQRVVVNAPPHAAGRAGHHERPVFVERVARLRVITECVQPQRAQAASVQVQRAGLVTQPVVTLSAVTREVMPQGTGTAAGEISRGLPVA